jgi:hypothetical protein
VGSQSTGTKTTSAPTAGGSRPVAGKVKTGAVAAKPTAAATVPPVPTPAPAPKPVKKGSLYDDRK